MSSPHFCNIFHFIIIFHYKGHSGWHMYMYVTLISSIISYLTLKYFFSIIKTKSNEYVEANKQTILHS